MAEVEDAPPADAAEGGTSTGGKKGRYRREKPWVRNLSPSFPPSARVRRRCRECACHPRPALPLPTCLTSSSLLPLL